MLREERSKRQRLEQALKKENITYTDRIGRNITRWVVKHYYVRNDHHPAPYSWAKLLLSTNKNPKGEKILSLNLPKNIYDVRIRTIEKEESRENTFIHSGKFLNNFKFYFYGWLYRTRYKVFVGENRWRNLLFYKGFDNFPVQTVEVLWFTLFWRVYRYSYKDHHYILLDRNNFITRWFATKLFDSEPPIKGPYNEK